MGNQIHTTKNKFTEGVRRRHAYPSIPTLTLLSRSEMSRQPPRGTLKPPPQASHYPRPQER